MLGRLWEVCFVLGVGLPHGIGLRPATAADSSQDYQLLEGHIEGGRTSITFTRLLNTGDPNDRVIMPGNMSVIWCVPRCLWNDPEGIGPHDLHGFGALPGG